MNDQVNYAKIQRIQDNLEALTIGQFGTGFVTDAMLYESGIKATVASHTSQLADIAINVKSFGAKGDGVTDDTTAIQNFVNYITTNHLQGIIPAGTYKITAAINIPATYQWSIIGSGMGVAIIKQYTNNTPIFILGYDNSASLICHTVKITDIEFQYANPQTALTNSTPVYFNAMYYESTFKRLKFQGYYGITVKAGVGGPWGCTFDELIFTGACYGGAMDWTNAVNAVPNNHFGRMFIDGVNMVSTIFNNIRGYNWTIDTLEFINTQQGATLMLFCSGSQCTIGAIKLENGSYTTSKDLIIMQGGCKIKLGQFSIGGNNMNLTPASGQIRVFKADSGGATGWLEIDTFVAGATTLTGNVYLLEGNTGSMKIKYLSLDDKNWQLSNVGGATSCETISIDTWNNNRLSSNKGDADYTIALGDANNISYETPLTATRTINLPSTMNNLFNGLKYRIRSYGAVNGSNVINIVCSGITKATLSADKTVVELTWRRAGSAQAGWIVTNYNTLP